jgi:hypothetical protein
MHWHPETPSCQTGAAARLATQVAVANTNDLALPYVTVCIRATLS